MVRASEKLRFAVLAVDVVYFRIIDNKLSLLLGKVTTAPDFIGKWALIGGLIAPDETADDAVKRHLKVKAGIEVPYTEQLYTFSAINRDRRGRVISVAYVALANSNLQNKQKAETETKWCPIAGIPSLAYDHDEIVRVAIDRLRSKFTYTTMAQFLLPEEFTLSELQKTYEIVMGKEMDKRNFRKKILSLGIIAITKKVKIGKANRPAALYRFKKRSPLFIDIL